MSIDPCLNDLDSEQRFDQIIVWDIETGGFSGSKHPLIEIGAGRYDFKKGNRETTMFMLDESHDELDIIRRAFDWLNQFDYEATVTYNGEDFDISFVTDCLNALKLEGSRPELRAVPHIDLVTPRKQLAAQTNDKWPSLEEYL